jgi:hypothetical protein
MTHGLSETDYIHTVATGELTEIQWRVTITNTAKLWTSRFYSVLRFKLYLGMR